MTQPTNCTDPSPPVGLVKSGTLARMMCSPLGSMANLMFFWFLKAPFTLTDGFWFFSMLSHSGIT